MYMLVSILVGALAACEPWCSHPCGELNGNVQLECGECDASDKCWPGAPGFNDYDPEATRRKNRQAFRKVVVEADGDVQTQSAYGSHGNPIQFPSGYFDTFVTGACDLESVDASTVTREMLNQADKPFLIKGLTRDWKAHKAWALDSLLERHGDAPFQLHASGNASLGKLLKNVGKYHMGHAVYPPSGCYSDPWRPYSPMLLGALREDYDLPDYLGPMVTFQMGVGTGFGVGVPPENHPSSWFAMVKGRKRWVLMPPEAGTARSGGPGTEPPHVMQGRERCEPRNKPLTALHCDQQEGDVIWVPSMWWHETCCLEDYSIGLGALTYDDCCPTGEMKTKQRCMRDGYRIDQIPACERGELHCGALPYVTPVQGS